MAWRTAVFLSLIAACGAAGCASNRGPELLRIEPDQYDRTFDAAMAAARRHDLVPTLRDRRSGVIETEPSIAASLLDFWRGENASVGQMMENTIEFQRRYARFEFTPAGVQPVADRGSDGELDLFGAGTPVVDLTVPDGPLELRVWVVVERAYSPGIRRSTWSRTLTTRATILRPATDPAAPTRPFWTPVSRDPAFERRLLAEVEKALGRP